MNAASIFELSIGQPFSFLISSRMSSPDFQTVKLTTSSHSYGSTSACFSGGRNKKRKATKKVNRRTISIATSSGKVLLILGWETPKRVTRQYPQVNRRPLTKDFDRVASGETTTFFRKEKGNSWTNNLMSLSSSLLVEWYLIRQQ